MHAQPSSGARGVSVGLSCYDFLFYTLKGAHDTSFAIKAGLSLCVIL